MKVYIIAGEASGDLHASNLMKALRSREPEVEFRFWGGDRMADVGGKPVRHIRELAFMGFVEVIQNLRKILGFLDQAKNDLVEYQPDVLVLVDYPGFNMRMARFAKERGIPVVYYISPQVWAWKQGRVEILKQTVDRMLVVLPFETEFYARFGMDVEFVGHPLLDEVGSTAENRMSVADGRGKPLVALLPGSRKQEISQVLPVFVETALQLPQYRFVLAAAPSVDPSFYLPLLGSAPIEISRSGTYALLRQASAALVTSGTATLETALFGVPQTVCFRANALSVWIARRLVKVRYISLVNLVLNRESVKELIQGELNSRALKQNLQKLFDETERERIRRDYDELAKALGGPGASERAALAILGLVKNRAQNLGFDRRNSSGLA